MPFIFAAFSIFFLVETVHSLLLVLALALNIFSRFQKKKNKWKKNSVRFPDMQSSCDL